MSLNAPEQAAVPNVHSIPRRYVALGLVVVAILLLGGLVLIRNNTAPDLPANAEVYTPAPSDVFHEVTAVPQSVSDAVGASSPASPITAPMPSHNTSLWEDSPHNGGNRPVVFFYGAEFAPYAAAERWPLIIALSRFGTFDQLGLVESSTSVAFPAIPTFTFSKTAYSSVWIDLQTVERYSAQDLTGSGYSSLQVLTPRQSASVSVYDISDSTVPLLDISNRYTLAGSAFPPSLLTGLTQSQIASALTTPTAPVTQAVLASANEITAAICAVTGERPITVCNARGVEAADDKLGIAAPH